MHVRFQPAHRPFPEYADVRIREVICSALSHAWKSRRMMALAVFDLPSESDASPGRSLWQKRSPDR